MLFDENVSWNLEEGKIEKQFVLVDKEQENSIHEDKNNKDSHQSTPRADLSSSSSSSPSSGSNSNSSSPSSTPKKIRSLSDVYASCNFCVVEYGIFEEAIKQEAWKRAMKEEIEVIKKNNTW